MGDSNPSDATTCCCCCCIVVVVVVVVIIAFTLRYNRITIGIVMISAARLSE